MGFPGAELGLGLVFVRVEKGRAASTRAEKWESGSLGWICRG